MVTNLSKNAASPRNHVKPGNGYLYDSDFEYDEDFDPQTGRPITYDGVGYASTPVNVAKNTASPTNQVKS